MTSRSGRATVIGVFVLALAFHLAVVSADFAVLAKNGYLYDDSFYAFKIARNIAHGEGVTFDGLHATNGFQPLYVFMLVPIFWLFGSSLTTPIYVALGFSALFTAFTAVLLFLIARRYAAWLPALFVALVWAFSPIVTRQAANGLETALALLLFAGTAHFYLTRVRPFAAPRRIDVVGLGALLGLTVLARVDQVFLALVIALDYLWLQRKRGDSWQTFKNTTTAFATALAVYAPWLVFSYLAVGRWLQESGAATRFLSMAYAPFFGLGTEEVMTSGPNLPFIWGHVTKAIAMLKVTPPAYVGFRAMEKVSAALSAGPLLGAAVNAAGLLLAVGLVVWLCRKRRQGECAIREIDFLALFGVVLMAAYAFYVFGVFFFVRYFYPVYFVACIYLAFLGGEGWQWLRRQSVGFRRLAAAGIGLYVAAISYMAYTSGFRSTPVYHFYDAATWVNENTAPHETVGVFQGGAIGYLADRQVVNLDGKVNGEALEALRDGRLPAYLKKEGVDVVLDNSRVLDLFLGEAWRRDLAVVGEAEIMAGTRGHVPGWSAYRIRSPWLDNMGSGMGSAGGRSDDGARIDGSSRTGVAGGAGTR